MTTIHLEPNKVPAHLQHVHGYSGKTFKARVAESVTIPMDAGLWSGDSRESYLAVELASGKQASHPMDREAPWGQRKEHTVTLRPGFAIVMHNMFCGKDMGLTFFVHPSDAAALLPAPTPELSPIERNVLIATRSLKSSYGGRNRRELWNDSQSWRTENQISEEQWEAAKASLINKGLLTKAGAITPAGRNAVPT